MQIRPKYRYRERVECLYCDYDFTAISSMHRHMLTTCKFAPNADTKKERVKCLYCDYDFVTNSSMYRHMQTTCKFAPNTDTQCHRDKRKRVKCLYCDSDLATSENMHHRIRTACKLVPNADTQKKVKCLYCNSDFTTNSNMYHHIRTACKYANTQYHISKERIKCLYCNHDFTTKGSLHRQMQNTCKFAPNVNTQCHSDTSTNDPEPTIHHPQTQIEIQHNTTIQRDNNVDVHQAEMIIDSDSFRQEEECVPNDEYEVNTSCIDMQAVQEAINGDTSKHL